MSIKNIKERLEGSYRLIRIKRIKYGFFIIEIILALILASVMATFMGAKADPLYIPLDIFLFIVLIMVLLITIEAIYFKGMEIKFTRNKSRRFLVARNAVRRSMVIIAISALCVAFLMLPYTQDEISNLNKPEGTWDIQANATQTISFMSQDNMGLTRMTIIHVDVTNAQNEISLDFGAKNLMEDEAGFNYTCIFEPEDSKVQDMINIAILNNATEVITVSYYVTNEISSLVKLYIPALGLAFIIVQFAAISIMYPIREMYASSSIYSKKYVATTDSGEYSVKDILKKSETKTEEDKMLDEVLDLELPPPEPVTMTADSSPQEQVCIPEPEMARARGKVDDGLIEEPDVKCSNCGEMNSAQAAMCFSCGTPLVSMEKLAIDPLEYLKKGETFAKAGRYEDAITCYDETLKSDAVNELALLRKGEALHKLGKWGSAIQYVNTALKVNPNNIDTLILKARILDERDRLDKSMEIYSQILALDPNNPIAKAKMEKVSQKFVEAAEEAEIESAEDVLEQFMCVPGIGLARATALYDAGFTSMDMLKGASEEKLAGVKGISKGIAKKVRKALNEL